MYITRNERIIMTISIDSVKIAKNTQNIPQKTKNISTNLLKINANLDEVDLSTIAKEAKKKDFSQLSFAEKIALVMNAINKI